MRLRSVLAAVLPWAVVASNEVQGSALERRLVEVSQEHAAAQKQLKDVSDDLQQMETYMQELRRSTNLELEDDAKKDHVLSQSFKLLGVSTSEEPSPLSSIPPSESLAQESQRLKLQATSAAQRVKALHQQVAQQQEMLQEQKQHLEERRREMVELQRAVTSMHDQARDGIAADHDLELKYQQQTHEYEKDVDQLETELRKAKAQLSTLQATQLRQQQVLAEGKHQMLEDEHHLQLQQQKRQEEELHQDAMQRQVLQLQDDITSGLKRFGAGGSHDERLTALVRVAEGKQQGIETEKANVSVLEAEVRQDALQLDQLKAKEDVDARKVQDEIQEIRQRKLYRVRAAQDMYHKLPEVFTQRARMDDQRRGKEARAAEDGRAQQRKLREARRRSTETAEEEELHTELRSSKQRLQSINPQANNKKSMGKKRLQQLRARLAETKRDEAKEMKKFMQRSDALQQEIRQDEAKSQRKTSEKSKAVEKMQGELLTLEDRIDTLSRQQNQLASEAAQLSSTFSLQQMQDQQDIHRAKIAAEHVTLEESEKKKEEKRRHDLEIELQGKALLQKEQLESEARLRSTQRHLEKEVDELRSSSDSEQQGLQSLAKTLRAKQLAAAKMQKFLEKEPRLASAVQHTLASMLP